MASAPVGERIAVLETQSAENRERYMNVNNKLDLLLAQSNQRVGAKLTLGALSKIFGGFGISLTMVGGVVAFLISEFWAHGKF